MIIFLPVNYVFLGIRILNTIDEKHHLLHERVPCSPLRGILHRHLRESVCNFLNQHLSQTETVTQR